jgi:AraC-like DNA-binding protein
MAKVRMFGLINTMVNAMSEIALHHEIRFLDSTDYAASLLESRSVPELRDRVQDMLRALDDYAANRRDEVKATLKTEVMKFVEDSYEDVNLNVSQIADQFGLSVSHLSRTFKKDAGVGLLDYIHIVRVEEAKRLLQDVDLSVGEIGRRVGYYSDVAFIRAFKRYEGVSPGKFRSLAQA